jgi:hypothetical protein
MASIAATVPITPASAAHGGHRAAHQLIALPGLAP